MSLAKTALPPAAEAAEKVFPDTLRVLIVDDDRLSARLLAANLVRPGRLEATVATSGDEALSLVARGGIDAVVADLMMPEMDGIELVGRLREIDRTLPVIVLTANATVERAVEAIRVGATDFLQKPPNTGALTALLERAVGERTVREEVAGRQEQRASTDAAAQLQGDHPRLDAIRAFARQLARVPDARVLITGETGTGKSRLARAIHDLSDARGRFVEVNCAALPAQLLETELFGHEKGAFTDAKALKRGLVELADRGTLLLDEIGAMSPELQAKLLMFIERREVRRVGGTEPIPVRCRVIAATHENLRQRVREGSFRQDLLFRLDVASVAMPPLREISSVIPQLVRALVRELCEEARRPAPKVSEESLRALVAYEWPGNVRELRNAVERALIFHASGLLVIPVPEGRDVLAPEGDAVVLPLGLPLDEVERRYIEETLARPTGDLEQVAASLGISRKTLWDRRRRYKL